MSHLDEGTPPPPPFSEAPPFYCSNESLSSHHSDGHPSNSRNSQSQVSVDSEEVSIARTSGDSNQSNEEPELQDLPPPYSPGLGGILSSQRHDVDDGPPTYHSLFGQIREAREQSSNNFTFLSRVGQIILNTVGCTILLVVFMSVPIAILVIGSIFVNDCPSEPFIPIYLIVGGISGIIKNIGLILENIVQRYSDRLSSYFKHSKYFIYLWRAVNLIFNLFMLAWTIAGGYWVYHIYTSVTSKEYRYCNELLYKFGFGIVTSSYILLFLTTVCACCCIGVCLKINKRRNRSERLSSRNSSSRRESLHGDDYGSQVLGLEEEEEVERYTFERESVHSVDNELTTAATLPNTADDDTTSEAFLRRFRYLDVSEPIDTSTYNRVSFTLNHSGPRQYENSYSDRDPQEEDDNVIFHYDSSPYPTRHYSIQHRASECATNHQFIDHTPFQSPDPTPNTSHSHQHHRPCPVDTPVPVSYPVTSRGFSHPVGSQCDGGARKSKLSAYDLYVTTTSTNGLSVTVV